MKIGFIGAGNMGSALIKAVAVSKNAEIYVYDKDTDKAKRVADINKSEYKSPDFIYKNADMVFLGVKPGVIPEIAAEAARCAKDGLLIVSMAAGVSIKAISEYTGGKLPIIRIMPNTPASVGKGMILYSLSELCSEEQEKSFVEIMKGAGAIDKIPERLIDAASAVSGCGPAFVYLFIEALADGGVAAGLTRDMAMKYATETVIGAAETVKATGIHPAALKDMVCSPGGSTIEGVMTLERGAFRATVSEAVVSAYEKTKTLGKSK